MRSIWILLACVTLVSGCGGPEEGDSCETEGGNDHQATCNGDDLLFCVCDEYDGSSCPTKQGTWVKQDILCTCDEWMDDRCPME